MADPLAQGRDVIRRSMSPAERPTVSSEAVAVRIADFLVRTHAERVDLFRMHLRATVRTASPLLLDLAAYQGVDLQKATGLILPPQEWPWRPLHDNIFVPISSLMRRRATLRGSGTAASRSFERVFAAPGVVIRGVSDPAGRFGIRPVASVLAFTAAVGPCLLSSSGSTATLKFADPIPEALMLCMPGRPLDDIVRHPVFDGGGYVVRRALVDTVDGAQMIEFQTRLVPFEMALGAERP